MSAAAEFSSSGGFMEMPRSLFTHGDNSAETIELTVVTDQPNGLLLWQGQTAPSDNSKDFIGVVVRNGKVQFRFGWLLHLKPEKLSSIELDIDL